MNDCSCIVDPGFDGCCEFSRVETRTARKEHTCGECREKIKPGCDYEVFSGKFDGYMFRSKTCLPCVEVRDCFCCSWSTGYVWDDIRDGLDGIVKLEGVSNNLESLSSKAREKFFGMVDLRELEE